MGAGRAPSTSPDSTTFVVEAFSRADGKRIWERQIAAEGTLTPVHDKHNLTSPSPVSDGSLVFVWLGTGQIVGLARDGRVVWQRHLGKEISPFDVTLRDSFRIRRSA